jgi:tRNA (cmo5U34)-methyltransferase
MVHYDKDKNNTDEFSFETIGNFDEHISISIPNYDFLSHQCKLYSDYFIREHTNVVDLGCSSGKFLNELNQVKNVEYYGYDVADNLFMTPKYDSIHLEKRNLVEMCEDWSKYPNDISFAISLFTLQFLPPIKREEVIRTVSNNMTKGGAFISCEKIYSSNAKLQDITNSIYYQFKNKSFTGDQILSKERDLRRIMNPLSLKESMDQLSCVGEPNVFFMSYNFVGLIAIKE